MAISTILLPQLIATMILAATFAFSIRFKDVPEAKYFRAAIAIGLVWAVLYGLELNAGLLSDKVLFAKVRFLFLPFITLTYLLMAASYAGKAFWLSRRNVLLLSVIPFLTIIAMLTSDYTHLFRYDFGVRDVGDFSVLTFTTGPWYWIYVLYSYLLAIATVSFLMGTIKGSPLVYSRQAAILILGTLIPIAIDLMFNFGITPIPGYSLASSSMMVTGVLFFWALFSFHILDIKPVARSEVVDKMSDLYLVVDAKGRLVDFNKASAAKLGLSRTGGVGMELRTIMPSCSRFHDHLGGSSDFVEELMGIHDGDDVVYEATVIGLSNPGSPDNKLILLRDITQRKKAENELRLSKERYRELLDSSPFPITIARQDDGRLLFINRRAEHHFKISKEAAITMMIQDFYDDPSMRKKVLKSIDEEGRMEDFELMMRDVEGNTFWAFTSAILVDYQGAEAVFAEYNDISEMKRLSASVQSVNMKLNLLSTITRHDIRNDLMVINGHVELADTERDPSKLKDHLAKIKVACRRMDSLIEFAKTYQNLGSEPPGWYRVGDMFDEALNQLKMVNITASASVGDLKIFCDRLVGRVFYNLIDNSLRHGGHVSRIGIEFHESEQGAALVYSDDGIGIVDSDKARIFERGFGKNTGLGMYLTREILAITGMTIAEKGCQGQGVRFEIRIPKNMYRARK
ncbi:MAG TPA: histidine kinase N-terminal 7TM domain-containing protein [Methanomassiliicoccales archaeon]|jgi:PAS domain S-box-containing protein